MAGKPSTLFGVYDVKIFKNHPHRGLKYWTCENGSQEKNKETNLKCKNLWV